MCAMPLSRPDADAVLDAAVPLYWMFGRMDVTLPVLAQETGVAEGELEALFGDARGAFLAALDRYASGPASLPFAAWAEGGRSAFEAAVLELVYAEGTGRGCLLTLAIVDFAPQDPAVSAAVAGHAAALMAQATDRPDLPPAALLAALAAAATLARDGRPPAGALAALTRVLDAATIGPGTTSAPATAADTGAARSD